MLLVVLGILALAASLASGTISTARNLDAEAVAAVEAAEAVDGQLRIKVLFDFAPESFHLDFLQRYGVVAGADERSVTLRRVKASGVRSLASQYWVAGIEVVQ